jgi:chorismate mutase / prephenate dehydratase
MPPRQTSTADPQARLDALDDKIHDLLIRRAALANPASPAQQAATLRRLAVRHKGNLPLAMLVRVWREMMAVTAPAARTVHVYAADRAGVYRDMARDLFGSPATAIVHECSGDAMAFGVVPPPESDENSRAWWAQLTPSGQQGPRVVATLPLVGAEQPSAYVIGTLEPEPSGDDTSLLLMEAGENLSLTKLQALLKQGGLDARLLAVSRDSAGSASRQHLLEVPGFVRDNDSRLGVLREQAGDAILRIASVGCYANSLMQGASVP